MLAVLVCAVLSSGYATIVEDFKDKGIQYEEFGRARLMLERERCFPRRFALTKYVNSLVEDEVSDVDGLILRTKLQNTFATVCNNFNLSTVAPHVPDGTESFQQASGYLERFRLIWTTRKFDNDLRTLILHNKINPAFFSLIDEQWYDDDLEVSEFAAAAIVFPKSCNIAELTISVLLCSNFEDSAQQGVLYAIAHAGQFMPENKAFVFYEVPEYVVVVEEEGEIIPNGSFFLCMERAHGECDINTMDSCDIFALSTASNFTFVRTLGTGKIVATNQPEVNVNGTMVKASSPIFIHHFSCEMEETEDDDTRLVTYSKVVPVENEISFPGMSLSAKDAVHASHLAVRLYRLTRKGIPLLSDQPGKASVWDDVRDFFFHLI
ncbi:unnamed protein product [Haemonchus placei]|uniref:ZP domain-containing protein n=1 Tax=Haemonchus placei TaxID=6290 RepID=A0A0N4W2E7_HAEPC|nr:unnamed protein product [Haemonchus placei]